MKICIALVIAVSAVLATEGTQIGEPLGVSPRCTALFARLNLPFSLIPTTRRAEAVVSISIPQPEGEPKRIEQKYASGRHMIQFQAKPNVDGQGGRLQLGYDKDQIHKATIPLPLGDPPAVHPAIVNVLSPGESTQLVSRSLKGSADSLTLQVK